MANILFVTADLGGNVPPAIGIAAELRRRGHRVRFLGHEQQGEVLEGMGFAFEAYIHAGPWSPAFAPPGLKGLFSVCSVFADRGIGEDLLAAVTREPAELVVIDCLLFGALAIAERAGLQVAVLMHSFYGFFRQIESWRGGPVALITRLKGHRPLRLWSAADLVLVPTLRELDPAGHETLPNNVVYTGPVWQAGPIVPSQPSSGEPLVLVSLSTQNYDGQVKALQSILTALGGLRVRALVTTGPAVDPGQLAAPANAELQRFVPHAEVMPKASLVVGHGGHATTMAALAHGLPLVVMPMMPIDQVMIGRVLEARGAARLISKKSSTGRIASAIGELLDDATHREAAERLGAAIRSRDGAMEGADQLEARLPVPAVG